MSRIPFDSADFDSVDLEEFIARFLNAGISLTVDGPAGVEEKKILRAFRGNKTGGVTDGGVDVVAKVEGGETWGFQCKLRTRGQQKKWQLSDSKTVINEATYPADRYFLVVVSAGGHSMEAAEFIESNDTWHFWDGDVLSSQFLNRVGLEEGIRILEKFFDPSVAKECYGLLQDEVLIPASRFFEATTNSDSPFNHLAKLVGRRDFVDSIHRFVEASPRKVLLVAARGGEGKSRGLLEFGEEFESRHYDRVLRFVNPYAREAAEDSLGYLLKKGLVVIHEDAHRTETLRSRVLAAIAGDAKAKLILTIRPQGIDAVRGILRGHGIGADAIEPMMKVSHLSATDMIKLAESVLGPSPLIEPRILANWSDRSPLICVVGGNLIRTQALSPADIPDSRTFREEVFGRFEDQNLESISQGDLSRKELLKRMLRALAALAPFPLDRPTEKKLADFLDIRGSQLEERLSELEVAEVISKTGKGWRVGPDLFADHLVYSACVKGAGPTVFCSELIETFGADHFAALLRNLSEVEWRARIGGHDAIDLTTPLWERFLEKFEQSTFWERREMLESWSAFSIFLPEKSIALARLAVALDDALIDHSSFSTLEAASHRGVVEIVPNLLKPVGIYHLDEQFEVFDILARLGRNWSPGSTEGMRDEDNHPWVVIGKAATFALDQPIDSVTGVVSWLHARLGAEWFTELADQRCNFFSVVLGPIFKRVVERTYSVGMQVVFQAIPLDVENTAPMRDAAFELIATKIIPRSENAALNVIPVLNSASSFYGVGSDTKVHRSEWLPNRLRAIGLLKKCVHHWNSTFVRFSVWTVLAERIPYEKDQEVIDSAKGLLGEIPRDLSLSVAFATLGTDGEILLEDDLTSEPDYKKSWENRKEFPPKVAVELLDRYRMPEELLAFLVGFDQDASDRGFYPNWSPLLSAIAEADSSLGTTLIAHTLSGRRSFLDRYVGTLIDNIAGGSCVQKDEWIAEAIGSSNHELMSSALNTFLWRGEPPGKLTVEAFKQLLRSSGEEDRKLGIRVLSDTVSLGHEWTMKIIPEIPFDELGDSTVGQLAGGLVKAIKYNRIQIKIGVLRPILARIELLDRISSEPYPAFLRIVSDLAPRETYELVRRRIERFETQNPATRNDSYNPVPCEISPWRIPNLEKEQDFDAIVDFLIERVRNSESKVSCYWKNLFQAAVLMNSSPRGVEALRVWLTDTEEIEEVEDIAYLFNVRGSPLVFRESGFVKLLLEKVSGFPPDKVEQVHRVLIPDTPMRGYSSGELDPEYQHILEEARKAASAHADDPILKPFFDAIIDRELRDRERHREEFQNHMLAMG